MRTRRAPNCRVRQSALPRSPGCSVGAIADQSVVPNGISLICIDVSPAERNEPSLQLRAGSVV
jgi:hypothetical protein